VGANTNFLRIALFGYIAVVPTEGMMIKDTILLCTTLFLAALLTPHTAFADRHVVINGELQRTEHVDAFEQHCGPIADGFYWLNWNTGDWGYPGDRFPCVNHQ
jgi:hypothetical protein